MHNMASNVYSPLVHLSIATWSSQEENAVKDIHHWPFVFLRYYFWWIRGKSSSWTLVFLAHHWQHLGICSCWGANPTSTFGEVLLRSLTLEWLGFEYPALAVFNQLGLGPNCQDHQQLGTTCALRFPAMLTNLHWQFENDQCQFFHRALLRLSPCIQRFQVHQPTTNHHTQRHKHLEALIAAQETNFPASSTLIVHVQDVLMYEPTSFISTPQWAQNTAQLTRGPRINKTPSTSSL